jgi:hypothetical protein
MNVPTLSTPQKVILWASLALATVVAVYPTPAHYQWDGQQWVRDKRHYSERLNDRRFVFDYDPYSATRPNGPRATLEAGLLLAFGVGLAAAVKNSTWRASRTSKIAGILAITSALNLIALNILTAKASEVGREISQMRRNVLSLDADLSSIGRDLSAVESSVSSIESDISSIELYQRYR